MTLEAYAERILSEKSYGVASPLLSRSQIAGQRIRQLRQGVTLDGATVAELIEEGRE